jgi:hypothetical protein
MDTKKVLEIRRELSGSNDFARKNHEASNIEADINDAFSSLSLLLMSDQLKTIPERHSGKKYSANAWQTTLKSRLNKLSSLLEKEVAPELEKYISGVKKAAKSL